MSLLGTGWFRRQRRETPAESPTYLRIASDEHAAVENPIGFDLYAFDALIPPAWQDARIQEILPSAAVSVQDVLGLAASAAWPEDHPIAIAITAAWRVCNDGQEPQRAGIWHLSTGRGLQGYLNGYHVLIGNEQLMRDGGIALTQETQEQITVFEQRGWQTVLIGARASAAEREDVHRSLMGVLAIGPCEHVTEYVDLLSAPPNPGVLRDLTAVIARPAHLEPVTDRRPPRRRRLPRWQLIGVLALISALAGLYKSSLRVGPDEVAVVRRFGCATVCPPGLHFRSLWPVEQITRVKNCGVRVIGRELGVRAIVEYQITEPINYAFAAKDPEGILSQVAETALRETTAASSESELSTEWRDRMEKQLAALLLGLTITSTSVSKTEPTARKPEPASQIREMHDLPGASTDSLVEDAQIQAAELTAEARAAAGRIIQAARDEAERLVIGRGAKNTSFAHGRLERIRELIGKASAGQVCMVVNPELGAGCRMYLRTGKEIQPESLWAWPASRPAAPEEGQP